MQQSLEIYQCVPHILPAIAEHTALDQPRDLGIEKLKDIIAARVYAIDAAKPWKLESETFDQPETLQRLCRVSGGHVRNLILLVQLAIDYNETEQLPIRASALDQAIQQLRSTYRNTVNDNQWALLAKVYRSKRIPNDDEHRSLLFNRCGLEYRDADGETWHDVHPLILNVPEFKDALA